MKKLFLLLLFAICSAVHAQDNFIGTHSSPIPLKGSQNQVIKNLTLYFFNDYTYKIKDNGRLLFTGQFKNNDYTVEFSNYTAFANKAFYTHDGKEIVCLQTVFYQPEKYRYQADIFCP